MMDALTAQGRVNTRVLQTNERWFGLTYQDDKPGVVAALRALHADGTYPRRCGSKSAETANRGDLSDRRDFF